MPSSTNHTKERTWVSNARLASLCHGACGHISKLCTYYKPYGSRDSVVGIATRYGDRIPVGARCYVPVQTGHMGQRNFLYNEYRVFPGDKAAGAWRWPPTPSSVDVKKSLQLYLYSPSGSSWPVLGWTLPLPLLYKLNYNLSVYV